LIVGCKNLNTKLSTYLKFLYNLELFGIKLGLNNIQKLLNYCENPQNNYPTIHIAGTNGKGTTAHAIAATLQLAGYKVGLYTSPHLIRFAERIKINGCEISDSELNSLVKLFKSEIIKSKSTFFEATTTIAFKYFSDKKVDIAVIETGLGGRLDATNILKPICSVITSIGMDHTKELGNSLKLITKEKGGIIKSQVPLFTNVAQKSSLNILKNIAKKNNSKVRLIEANNNLKLSREVLKFINLNYLKISKSQIYLGLKKYKQLTGLHGRFEIISKKPLTVLDVAHNPDAIKNLVNSLKYNYPKKKFIVLFGVMKDKDYGCMCKELLKLNPIIISVQANTNRSLSSKIITNYFLKKNLTVINCKQINTAYELAKKLTVEDQILVITGSHYVVGEVLQNHLNA